MELRLVVEAHGRRRHLEWKRNLVGQVRRQADSARDLGFLLDLLGFLRVLRVEDVGLPVFERATPADSRMSSSWLRQRTCGGATRVPPRPLAM